MADSLILASASPIRSSMLKAAGIAFRQVPAGVEEAVILKASQSSIDASTKLAEEKAITVSRDEPNAWVIGSDSIVEVGGQMLQKPADREQATEHLRMFSGKVMTLTSAVALARDGRIEWSLADQAELQVRPLSEQFIQQYLDSEWPEVGYCVGVFRMEGRGVQLFDSTSGQYFTILGMPLLPLLGALRERGLIEA